MSDITLVNDEGKIELSRPVASNLSTKQYYFVKHDASEKVVITTAANISLGVLQDAPDGSVTEKVGTVRVGGLTLVKAGGAIAFGDYLTPDGNGAAVKANGGEHYNAIALTSADSADLFLAFIVHGQLN